MKLELLAKQNGAKKSVIYQQKIKKRSHTNYEAVRRSRERSRRKGEQMKEEYARNQKRIEELQKLFVKLSDELEGRALPEDLVHSSVIEGRSGNTASQFDPLRDTNF